MPCLVPHKHSTDNLGHDATPGVGGGHSQYILVGVCRGTSKKGGGGLKPQSHRIVRFFDRTIGCDLVSYDRSAMFAAISFYNRMLLCILYDWW